MHSSSHSACNYCNGSSLEPLLRGVDTRGDFWTWGRCPSCGAVSLTPRPSVEQLSAAYAPSYYGESTSKFEGPVETFIESCRQCRARRIGRGLAPGARVLDVGCGNGGFLAALGSVGSFHLHGNELEGGSARRAAQRPGIALKIGTLEPGDFGDMSLDLVTLFHVFEHLTEPRQTLALIHRALKRDGSLVMSFPNISSIQARLFRDRWLHLDPPRHLFLFPTDDFERAMRAAGFRVAARRYFSIEQNPFGFIQSLLNCVLGPRDLLYERLKGHTTYAPKHGAGSIFLQKAAAALLLGPAIILDATESALGRGATVEYTLTKIQNAS